MTEPKGKHGGARPGAGRPRTRPRANVVPAMDDPLLFLLTVMRDESQSITRRCRAAVALLPFCHAKATADAPKVARPTPKPPTAAVRWLSTPPPTRQ